jgi:hypothetical protein
MIIAINESCSRFHDGGATCSAVRTGGTGDVESRLQHDQAENTSKQ